MADLVINESAAAILATAISGAVVAATKLLVNYLQETAARVNDLNVSYLAAVKEEREDRRRAMDALLKVQEESIKTQVTLTMEVRNALSDRVSAGGSDAPVPRSHQA